MMFTADQQTALNSLIQGIFPMTIRGVTFSYNDPANLNASVQVAYGRDLFPAERPTVIFKYTVGQSQIRFLDGWLPDVHVDTVVAVYGEPTRYIPLNNSYIDIPVVLTDVPSSALQLYIKQNTTHKSNLKIQLLNSDMIAVEEHKLWYYEIEEDDWTVVLPGNLNIIPDEYTLRVTEEWFSTDIFDATANSLSIGQGNGYYPYKYTKSDVYDNAGEINFIKLQITCIARNYKTSATSTQIRGHIIADRIAKRIKHEINKGDWLTTLSATGLTLYNVTGVTYTDSIPLEGAESIFRTVIEASGAIPLGLDAEDLSGEEAAILADGVNVEDIRLDNERVGAIQDAVPRKVSDASGTYVGVPSLNTGGYGIHYYENFASPFEYTVPQGTWTFTPALVGVTGGKLQMNLDNNSASADFVYNTRVSEKFTIETYISIPNTSTTMTAGFNAYDTSEESTEIYFAIQNFGAGLVLYFYASIDFGINFVEKEFPLVDTGSFEGTLKLVYDNGNFDIYLNDVLQGSQIYTIPIAPDMIGYSAYSAAAQLIKFDNYKTYNYVTDDMSTVESVSPTPIAVADDTGSVITTPNVNPNVIRNPGFEAVLGEEWTGTSTRATGEYAYTGSYGLRVSVYDLIEYTDGYIEQTINNVSSNGATLTMYQRIGAEGIFRVTVYYLDGTTTVKDFTQSTWTLRTVNLQPNKSITKLRLEFVGTSGTLCACDDVALRISDADYVYSELASVDKSATPIKVAYDEGTDAAHSPILNEDPEYNPLAVPDTSAIPSSVADGSGDFSTYAQRSSDITTPNFTATPEDIGYDHGSTENTLSWTATDYNAGAYILKRGVTQVATGYWESGVAIVVNVDGYDYGVHTMTMTVYDTFGNNSFDSCQLTVSDTTYPIVNSDVDPVTYTVGSTSNIISWTATDDNPGTYKIYDDSLIEVDSGSWTSGVPITYDIDGLSVEIYEYKIEVKDTSDNMVEDTITVIVEDAADPIFTDIPSDLNFTPGTTGNTLSWTATDDNPKNYTVVSDVAGTVDSGSWTSGVPIVVDVDALLGTHNVTITVYDVTGRNSSDVVVVTAIGNVIVNGGFEDVLGSEWTGTSTRNGQAYYTYSGSFGLAVSVYDGAKYDAGYLEQTINNVPSNYASTLTLYHKGWPGQSFRVTITYSDVSTTIADYSSSGGVWVLRTINLDSDKLITKLRVEFIGENMPESCACDEIVLTV